MNKSSSLEQKIASLNSELAKITKELSKAPNGSLNAVKTSNGFKYFQIEKDHGNVKRTYIKKENIELATALAKKRYNKVRKHEIENEIASIKQKMDRTPKISSTDLLYNVPGYSNLLQALLNPNYIKQQKWLSQPYIHNDKHQETLRFKTSAGITVRSKSETLIVRGLSDYNIFGLSDYLKSFGSSSIVHFSSISQFSRSSSVFSKWMICSGWRRCQ